MLHCHTWLLSTPLLCALQSIPGGVVRAILPSADQTATFAATYRLTDDNELRDVSITGPFYPDVADVTYDITLNTSTKSFTVELPK